MPWIAFKTAEGSSTVRVCMSTLHARRPTAVTATAVQIAHTGKTPGLTGMFPGSACCDSRLLLLLCHCGGHALGCAHTSLPM